MLIIKITISIFGDNFYPKGYFNQSDKVIIISTNNPNDIENNEEIGFGIFSFTHKDIFYELGKTTKYEDDLITFFEENHSLFKKLGAEDFNFFTEVYYSGDQCNFEIFNRQILNRLSNIEKQIAFPVSIYHLNKKQIEELII